MVSYSGTGKPEHGYGSNSSKDSKILLGKNSGHVSKPKKFSKHKSMATVSVPSPTNDHVVHAEWHFKSEDTGSIMEWSSTSSEDMMLSEETMDAIILAYLEAKNRENKDEEEISQG